MIADAIAGVVGQVIERVWPDPAQKAAAAQALAELQQRGELAQLDADLKLALAQANINTEEAKSEDKFVSRWRPAVGWVCVAGLSWNYVGLPVASLGCKLAGLHFALQPADMTELLPLLFGMLGLGAMRTYEKVNIARQ